MLQRRTTTFFAWALIISALTGVSMAWSKPPDLPLSTKETCVPQAQRETVPAPQGIVNPYGIKVFTFPNAVAQGQCPEGVCPCPYQCPMAEGKSNEPSTPAWFNAIVDWIDDYFGDMLDEAVPEWLEALGNFLDDISDTLEAMFGQESDDLWSSGQVLPSAYYLPYPPTSAGQPSHLNADRIDGGIAPRLSSSSTMQGSCPGIVPSQTLSYPAMRDGHIYPPRYYLFDNEERPTVSLNESEFKDVLVKIKETMIGSIMFGESNCEAPAHRPAAQNGGLCEPVPVVRGAQRQAAAEQVAARFKEYMAGKTPAEFVLVAQQRYVALLAQENRQAANDSARAAQRFLEIGQECLAKGDLAMARNCFDEAGRVCPHSCFANQAACALAVVEVVSAMNECVEERGGTEAQEMPWPFGQPYVPEERMEPRRVQESMTMLQLGERYQHAGNLENAYRCFQDAHMICPVCEHGQRALKHMMEMEALKSQESQRRSSGTEEQEPPLARRQALTPDELQKRDQAHSLFLLAEGARRAGELEMAHSLYEETHLAFPDSYYGMMAIERLNEIENASPVAPRRLQTLLWFDDDGV